ncbi:MAG: GNAT family protein [Ilumatobacteraceae bacterium]
MPDTVAAGSLVLRRWSAADLPATMRAIELSIDDLQRWMPWATNGVPSIEAERAVFAAGTVDFDRDIDWGYSIIETPTDEVVGGCGVHPRDGHTYLEIGYWVRSDRHARGYATTAVRHLIDACFRHVAAAERVEIRMDVANVASARVPLKLGFVLLGEEEREPLTSGHTGHGLVWSVARSQWQRHRERT